MGVMITIAKKNCETQEKNNSKLEKMETVLRSLIN